MRRTRLPRSARSVSKGHPPWPRLTAVAIGRYRHPRRNICRRRGNRRVARGRSFRTAWPSIAAVSWTTFRSKRYGYVDEGITHPSQADFGKDCSWQICESGYASRSAYAQAAKHRNHRCARNWKRWARAKGGRAEICCSERPTTRAKCSGCSPSTPAGRPHSSSVAHTTANVQDDDQVSLHTTLSLHRHR